MGLAQNEMKAKPALPERVRSMEGLGVIRVVSNFYQPKGLFSKSAKPLIAVPIKHRIGPTTPTANCDFLSSSTA